MCSDNISIQVSNLSKSYQIYNLPHDRLKQFLFPRMQNMIGITPRQYYRDYWALKDVSFNVRRGETVGIIGRNGSGKSTLLQVISGILMPTMGNVDVIGRVAALLELGSGFNPDFTGRENVYLNGAILGLDNHLIQERFDRIAEFADIGEFIDQPVKTYSSGMMVRLAFSVSVNVDPDILIIDEALTVGDAAFQFKCMDRLEGLTQSGVTVLFVSHDLNSVRAFCDNVIYLDSGMTKAIGKADEVAELYLLDLHNLRKNITSKSKSVNLKPVTGNEDKIAFGTDQGEIGNIVFMDTNNRYSVYQRGEKIEIKVDVSFKETVKNPSVSIILQDKRTINLSGRYFYLNNIQNAGEICKTSIIFSFIAALQDGHYFITVRLEDRFSDSQFLIVEKQAQALEFEILGSGKKEFHGLFDMQITSKQINGME